MKKVKVEVPLAALTYAEAASMKQADRIVRFQVEASAGQRAFSAMGKLFRAIEANLTKKDKGIFPLLQKAGIPKGSISNASYAAKVFDLVEAGHLSEAEYDRLSHADCFNIVRVQSARSAKRLTAEEVVEVVRATEEPDEELASLYESGLTLDEVKAQQAATDAAKAAAEKAAADKAAADAAEIERIKAENEDLKAKAAEQQADVTPDPEEDESPVNDPLPPPPAEESHDPAPSVTPQSVIEVIDEVELAFAELDEDGQAIVRARLAELVQTLGVVEVKKKKAVAA